VRTVVALLRRGIAFELALYWSLFRWVTRRPDVPAGAVGFSYVGAVVALLWGFIGVSAVELVAVHLLLPWEGVRLAADILGVWGLVWMLGLAASFHVYPHVVDDEGLRVRQGPRTVFTVPWEAVESIDLRERNRDRSRALQVDRDEQTTVLNVVTASRTNVDLRLRHPLVLPLRQGAEPVTELRFLADDARALRRQVREHLAHREDAPR
jgi:hypothetical protein